jgi:hypothetical protein
VPQQFAFEADDAHVEIVDLEVDAAPFVGSAHPDVQEPRAIAHGDIAVCVDAVGAHPKVGGRDG